MQHSSIHDAPPELSSPAREALYATGHALLAQERYGDAAAVFRILLQLAPTDERGWLALGVCHERIEQPEVAIELYTAGMYASSAAARCAMAQSRLLRRLGRDNEADHALDQAAEWADRVGDDELLHSVETERQQVS